MVELADTLDLGSSAERCESSSLSWGTISKHTRMLETFEKLCRYRVLARRRSQCVLIWYKPEYEP